MMHYARNARYGSTDEPHLRKSISRFWSRVTKTDKCWLWTGPTNQYGYGVHTIGTTWLLAHRYAWQQVIGDIAAELELDHVCHDHNCVNPNHLRPVTSKQNHENMRGAFSNSKSGVRGVSWDKDRNLWRASVGHNYRQILVGRFQTMEEAEAAVIAKRNELFTHNNVDRVNRT
jgi:hypothetical protein